MHVTIDANKTIRIIPGHMIREIVQESRMGRIKVTLTQGAQEVPEGTVTVVDGNRALHMYAGKAHPDHPDHPSKSESRVEAKKEAPAKVP